MIVSLASESRAFHEAVRRNVDLEKIGRGQRGGKAWVAIPTWAWDPLQTPGTLGTGDTAPV